MLSGIMYYYSRFGFDGVMSAIRAKLSNGYQLLKVTRPDIKHSFYLRFGTSDIPTFDQVFINQEYDFLTNKAPQVIIDAGANIGLASIYFANKYPTSKIIAIEPEASNYELLKKNIESYPNIIPVNAALWDKNEAINLMDPGLGKWGFMTQENDDSEKHLGNLCHQVPGMTISKIMDDYGLARIDILKIDIEGAEREVFNDSSAWIGKVDSAIIELHERMKSGCNRSFYNGSNGFDREWQQGENVYLSRGEFLAPRCT